MFFSLDSMATHSMPTGMLCYPDGSPEAIPRGKKMTEGRLSSLARPKCLLVDIPGISQETRIYGKHLVSEATFWICDILDWQSRCIYSLYVIPKPLSYPTSPSSFPSCFFYVEVYASFEAPSHSRFAWIFSGKFPREVPVVSQEHQSLKLVPNGSWSAGTSRGISEKTPAETKNARLHHLPNGAASSAPKTVHEKRNRKKNMFGGYLNFKSRTTHSCFRHKGWQLN